MTETCYPWQEQHWQALMERRRAGRLAHALLLGGPGGLGKRAFARQVARALLCEQPRGDGHGCGVCAACQLLEAGSHPDYQYLAPEEDSKVIKIGQVRELIAGLALTSQRGGHRVAVLDPADRLNTEAANSLLKTLEEPGPGTLLMLVTDQPGYLPATIRSRCQKLTFARPPLEVTRPWLAAQLPDQDPDVLLALAAGAPLTARALAEGDALERRAALVDALVAVVRGERDPLAVAESWQGEPLGECVGWLRSWVMDLIRLKSAPRAPGVANRDLGERLQTLAERVDLRTLFDHLDRLQRAARLTSTAVSPQTVLEDVLIPWRNPAVGR